MKKILASVLLFGTFATLQAQTADSIALRSNGYYAIIEEQLYDSPLLFTGQNLGNFTQTQLDFQHEDLRFKRVQTAEKLNHYHFRTSGIYNFDPSLRVFGSLQFRKTDEEQVGYTLSHERTHYQEVLTPNYFIAPQKGDWNNQHYQLAGGVTKAFSDHYLLGGSVNYTTEKYIRTVDPRPQTSLHDLGGNLHLGLQFDAHRIYGYAGLRQKTETSSISYVNQWNNAPAYPETYTRFSSGYGRLVYSNTYSNYIFRTLYQRLGAGYHYQNEQQQFYLNYAYEKGMKDLYARDANGNVYINEDLISHKYRTITYSADANYIWHTAHRSYKAQLRWKDLTGDNYSVLEQGQNYRATQQAVGATIGTLSKANGRTHYRLEMYTDYNQNRYIDLLGYTDKKVNSLTSGFILGSDVYFHPTKRVYLEGDLGFYKALDEGLIYNPTTTNNYFANGVIFPDHAYDANSRLQASLLARFSMQLPKQRELGIFANYTAWSALGNAYRRFAPELNTQTSSQFQLGLTITY